MPSPRKKLIEVALPLDAINAASASMCETKPTPTASNRFRPCSNVATTARTTR